MSKKEAGKFVNTSGLKPLGRAVLVRPYEKELDSSFLIIPAAVREKTSVIEQRAIVIEVGSEAWRDESEPRAKPGDKVMVAKYAGWAAIGPQDGKIYRMVNANDIFAQIVGEEKFDVLQGKMQRGSLPKADLNQEAA